MKIVAQEAQDSLAILFLHKIAIKRSKKLLVQVRKPPDEYNLGIYD